MMNIEYILMSHLGEYYNELSPIYTPQGTGMVVSSDSLALMIKPGNYSDGSLINACTKNTTQFELLATVYSLKIGDEVLPWPTLLPIDQCPLIDTPLNKISVDIFNHPITDSQPVIACEACYTCPTYNMCQGTNVRKIVSNSNHRVKRKPSTFRYSHEALTTSIFEHTVYTLLKRVNWLNLCLPAMRALDNLQIPETTLSLPINLQFVEIPSVID